MLCNYVSLTCLPCLQTGTLVNSYLLGSSGFHGANNRQGVNSIPELELTFNSNPGTGIDFRKSVGIDLFGNWN